MGKRKEIKQLLSETRQHAARAEDAADRAEAALQAITGSAPAKENSHRAPVYTAPRGSAATPPAAEIP